jgi:hypothetical protein
MTTMIRNRKNLDAGTAQMGCAQGMMVVCIVWEQWCPRPAERNRTNSELQFPLVRVNIVDTMGDTNTIDHGTRYSTAKLAGNQLIFG